MNAATPSDVAFSLAIPPSWEELDLRPSTRDRSIAFMVSERVKAIPQLAPLRTAMVAYLRDMARHAWETGARYCGAFIEGSDEGILPGSVTVSILPPPPATGGGNMLDSIVDHLHGIDQTIGGEHWSQTTMAKLAHAGRAARTYGVHPVQAVTGQPAISTVLMHTYVPFDGGVALIACASPATAAAEPLLELFDAVTDTFRLHLLHS